MSRIFPDDGRNFPYTLLGYLYRKGGQEMKAKVRVPERVAQGKCAEEGGGRNWFCTGGCGTWSEADFDRLVECNYVTAHEIANGHTSYRLSPNGLAALRKHGEADFCRLYGVSAARAEDVIISRATFVSGGLSGYSLDNRSASDFIEFAEINVWGQVKGSDEPFLLAVAQMFFIDAEAALHIGGFSLEEVIAAHPEASQYRDLLCNQDLDGEAAQHIYELTDMLDLEEAIGRQLVIMHDLRVAPAFIGKRVGWEVGRRLLTRYGVGGGIVMAPLRPYGAKGKAADEIASRHIARTVVPAHVKRHPFVPRALVGDIRKFSQLP